MPDEFNIDIAIESNDFSGITLTDTMRGVIDLNTGETTGAIKVANNDFSGITQHLLLIVAKMLLWNRKIIILM